MLGNILGWLVFVAFALFFGWLTWRAWKAKRAWVKWPGVVLAGLLTLMFIAITGIIGRGLWMIYAPPTFSPAPTLTVAGTLAQLARVCSSPSSWARISCRLHRDR